MIPAPGRTLQIGTGAPEPSSSRFSLLVGEEAERLSVGRPEGGERPLRPLQGLRLEGGRAVAGRRAAPSRPSATKASVRPSGESVKVVASVQPAKRPPSGGGTWKRTGARVGRGGGGRAQQRRRREPDGERRDRPRQPRRAPGARRGCRARGRHARRPSSCELHVVRRLPALVRVLGQAGAHHVARARAGNRRRSVARGGASARRISEATAAALVPAKARLPVAIS